MATVSTVRAAALFTSHVTEDNRFVVIIPHAAPNQVVPSTGVTAPKIVAEDLAARGFKFEKGSDTFGIARGYYAVKNDELVKFGESFNVAGDKYLENYGGKNAKKGETNEEKFARLVAKARKTKAAGMARVAKTERAGMFRAQQKSGLTAEEAREILAKI